MLMIIDEYTRECLDDPRGQKAGIDEVTETLADVMPFRGIPEDIRSDNGSV